MAKENTVVFDEARAASYAQDWARLAPINDALHLLINILLSVLPAQAQVLCVGVGTGSELISMAQAFPEWRFTAVEPAAPMLAVCRRRLEELGLTERCTLHEGYLDTLPVSGQLGAEEFDAATCLVVSHFLTAKEERRALFAEIARRLQPGGYVVSTDIAYDMAGDDYASLREVWLRMLMFTGFTEEEGRGIVASFGSSVAVLPPAEVAELIAAGGFGRPVQFVQSLLIHGWYARRAAAE